MQKVLKHLQFSLILLLFCSNSSSQEYRIRHYGVSDGISHPFVYSVNQDVNGFIWAGTGEGLCRFDGFSFDTDIIQDSIASAVVNISYRDSKGTLWFGFQTGDIISYDGTVSRIINTGEEIISSITGFAELPDGNMIFASQNNGIFILNTSTGEVSAIQGVEQGLYTSLFLSEALLLAGRQEGLAVYELTDQGREASLKFTIDELEYTRIQDIQASDNDQAFWIATQDQGLYHLSVQGAGYELHAIAVELDLESANLQSVFEDSEGFLWLSSLRNGVYRLRLPGSLDVPLEVDHYNKEYGLVSNLVKEVYQDIEGNIWIATYEGGLNLLVPQAFSIYNFDIPGLNNNIQSVFATSNNNIYLGGNEGLFMLQKGLNTTPEKIAGLPVDRITALWQINDDLLVGTDNNGLYALHIPSSTVQKVMYEANSLGRSVNSITGDSDSVYLGTEDGIYVFDINYNPKAHYTTVDGMPHNNVETVYIDRQGRLLFATQTNGIYQFIWGSPASINAYPAGNTEYEFKSIAEDEDGNIWAATYGDGIFYFNGDTVLQLTETSGLKNNYCYSLVFTENQNIWVGHRLGISRINTADFRVSAYDVNLGITGDCNEHAACVDPSGRMLLGTTEGIISYDPGKERSDKQPPFTNIISLLISDQEYDFNREIVLPYSLYKLRIDFIGLDYSDPQTVTYQYKLDGYDLEWSDVTSQDFATYQRIEDGAYTFYLRSYSNEGVTQEIPASFSIRIKLPFWKTWWFISTTLIVILLSLYLYIKIRERKQKQLQEYLEKELAARTKEVVEQKEVIETKNRDITDSINYAKRIQTSMLPSIKRLQQYFSGCFVFYSPRDIVSGDFYWFDRVNDNKFIIVCADSTGHGVPGAFMSMIGSTLIKDICTREAGNSPSQVLQALDNELNNTLNQNLEDGTKPSDGMDIIVCEIDLKTSYVRFASAMRPMIIYRNGEEVFIRGSRNSIGGHYEREDNTFMDEGMQLSKGDIIYMFSDGYSDQFGGPMGKKFKMVRLKNLLQDIHTKPMEEQFDHVNSTFNLWKEDYEQVDDVLFMGIKL